MISPPAGLVQLKSTGSKLVMKKGLLRSATALALDLVFALFLCYLLHWFVGFYFAKRAFITLRAGQPGTIWKGVIPWFLSLIGPYFYTLPLSFFLIYLPEAVWGWSIGKLLMGLRITGRAKDRWLRFIVKTSGFWGITLAFVLGSWQVLAFMLGIGVVVPLLGLSDRIAGTAVVRG